MSDTSPQKGVYEVPPSANSVPKLYDSMPANDNVQSLDSLNDVSIDLSKPLPPDAPQALQDAYYDALAAKAREGRNKNIEASTMEKMQKPLAAPAPGNTGTLNKPSKEDRQKLMEAAMGQMTMGGKNSTATRQSVSGPTEEQKKLLLQQAQQSSRKQSVTGPSAEEKKQLLDRAKRDSNTMSKAPSNEQKMELLNQAKRASVAAVKGHDGKEGPYAVVKKPNAPTAEQRKAMADAAAIKSSPSARRKPNGPTDEQRRKLMEQALAGSKQATMRPSISDADRQKLLQQGMASSVANSRKSSAPSDEDRRRLLEQAMGRR